MTLACFSGRRRTKIRRVNLRELTVVSVISAVYYRLP